MEPKLTDLIQRRRSDLGLPEIGTSSTQVGYSRLAVRRLEGLNPISAACILFQGTRS